MTARLVFAAALASLALAAPATAAPDLPSMTVDRADLPAGTSQLSEGSFDLDEGVPAHYRSFKLRRSSGFARLNSITILFKTTDDANVLLAGTRLAMRDPATRRDLAKITASQLGVRARRVRVGKPRSVNVGDGGFTVSIRANRRIPLMFGFFRLDRGFGEIDARGAKGPAGLRGRTVRVMRIAADRMRKGLSPQSLTAPTITGSATVGGVLRAAAGTWSDATSFTYAWQRCNAAGTCVAVPGATQAAYTVTAADAGSTLRVVVTAANAVGQTAAASAPTAPIPPAP